MTLIYILLCILLILMIIYALMKCIWLIEDYSIKETTEEKIYSAVRQALMDHK